MGFQGALGFPFCGARNLAVKEAQWPISTHFEKHFFSLPGWPASEYTLKPPGENWQRFPVGRTVGESISHDPGVPLWPCSIGQNV